MGLEPEISVVSSVESRARVEESEREECGAAAIGGSAHVDDCAPERHGFFLAGGAGEVVAEFRQREEILRGDAKIAEHEQHVVGDGECCAERGNGGIDRRLRGAARHGAEVGFVDSEIFVCGGSSGSLLRHQALGRGVDLLGLREHGTEDGLFVARVVEGGEEIRRDGDRVGVCVGGELLLRPPGDGEP